MRIDVSPCYGRLMDNQLYDTTVIVVDVLRATSSIICALNGGAVKVIPATDAGTAVAIAGRLGGHDCVLGGERGGIMINGFDIGNSPKEYLGRVVRGKTVIISTTNGTGAIHSVRSADTVLLGAMINRMAAAKLAAAQAKDILIVCAGTEGQPSADDLVTAGAIISAMRQFATLSDMSDMAILCERLFEDWQQGTLDLSRTFHYSRLIRLGFGEDVEFCLMPDTTSTVPQYKNGVITPANVI